MFGLGTGELVLFGGIVILLFGGKKLPQLGSALAGSIKNFKNGMKEQDQSVDNIDQNNKDTK